MVVQPILVIAIIAGIIALLLAILFAKQVIKEDPGNEKMVEVAGYIEEGAKTFLKVQYKILGIFVVALGILLMFVASPGDLAHSVNVAVAYWIGRNHS